MQHDLNVYDQGELVAAAATYRCTGCGELWATDQTGVRFPPCDACKEGGGRWEMVLPPDSRAGTA